MAGISVSVDVFRDLSLGDVNEDMARVSAQMAFWSDVWGSAQSSLTQLDAHYRHWRANYAKKLTESVDKLAEWKVKNEIEGDKTFLEFKVKIGEAERQVIFCRGMFESFETKARLLQSKGAQMRATLDTPTASRAYEPPSENNEVSAGNQDDDTPEEDDRAARLKAKKLFGKKEKA